jgi:hypothetical protein
MLTCIISGGQTGADQAGLRAAKAAGLETGGYAPAGWKTEAGPAPWLAKLGLMQCMSRSYADRTRRNVAEADGTLIFEASESPGTALTMRQCDRQKKPVRVVMLAWAEKQLCVDRVTHTPQNIAEWIKENDIAALNVAGHRESVCPGIGVLVERYLAAVFRELRVTPTGERP